METISTYTSRLTPGDVVLDHGHHARVLDVHESNTPGTWLVTLDHRGNDLALIDSAVSRDRSAVWQVVTSAHTVHVGDTVRIGHGAVEHEVTGFTVDGRARLYAAGRRQSRDVAGLVLVHRSPAQDTIDLDRRLDDAAIRGELDTPDARGQRVHDARVAARAILRSADPSSLTSVMSARWVLEGLLEAADVLLDGATAGEVAAHEDSLERDLAAHEESLSDEDYRA